MKVAVLAALLAFPATAPDAKLPVDLDDDPNAVIGRPFPVSDSVISQCRSEGMAPPSCVKIVDLLTRMAEEPRDLRWARETEAILHEWVSQLPDTTIRAIECRTSLCAIETSSMHGVQHGPSYDDPPSERVHRWIPLWARETDTTSAQVTVTMQLFIRRKTPKPRPSDVVPFRPRP